jgi:hypothetical protein
MAERLHAFFCGTASIQLDKRSEGASVQDDRRAEERALVVVMISSFNEYGGKARTHNPV